MEKRYGDQDAGGEAGEVVRVPAAPRFETVYNENPGRCDGGGQEACGNRYPEMILHSTLKALGRCQSWHCAIPALQQSDIPRKGAVGIHFFLQAA